MSLLSPGVQVTVTDESFSTGAGPGTVPLVFIATKQDKTTPDGTAIADGTTAANANNLYLISSQRELLQTFGNPDFNEVGGSAQNGYPLNEYGLLAAYSYLGVANRAYVIRADIDLDELEPLSVAPTGAAADNEYWVDLNNYVPGIFTSAGVSGDWTAATVDTFTNTTGASLDGVAQGAVVGTGTAPAGYVTNDIIASFAGDATTIAAVGVHLEYYALDSSGLWQKLDIATGFEGFWSPHYNVPTEIANGIWLKTTTPNSGLNFNLKRYDAALAAWVDEGTIPVYENEDAYYALSTVDANSVTAGTVIGFTDNQATQVGEATTAAVLDVILRRHNGNSTVVATGTAHTNLTDATPSLDITVAGTTGSVTTLTTGMTAQQVVQQINLTTAVTNLGITASLSSSSTVTITSTTGDDFYLEDGGDGTVGELGLTVYVAGNRATIYSNFETLDGVTYNYNVSTTQPTGALDYGTYWYDSAFDVDLLVKGTTGWIEITDDVFVQADEPTTGVSDGDVWVETDSGTAYPVLYRRTGGAWVLVDNTDQTTPLGIVFADARPESSIGVVGTGINNGGGADPNLDSDAPNPALFPGGTLLWNTRASGRNVQVWTQNAVTTDLSGVVFADRWVNASGNAADGSLITGAAAQKQVVIEALASTLASNEDIRNDTIFYNLIAAPGFTELLDEMLTLNQDRKEQAFVIGDTPFSLASDTTSLQNWASNANNAAGNGDDGLVTANEYLGVYYPSGLATNVDGSEVVVPASHMVLRQMAYNDQVAYPWFAPAGFSRGTITNASAVGYLDSEDEFVTVTLNEGQRDTLYNNNCNAIATLPGRGIVIWGQKTRYALSGALDRVNVARLVNYIRYQADQLAQPFLFEPNDSVTRDAVKDAFDSFLAELVTLRGVTDFLVVVDESNNTPARIDRNELWVDIAIQPTKAVEFIYIPIRLRNTGDDLQPGA